MVSDSSGEMTGCGLVLAFRAEAAWCLRMGVSVESSELRRFGVEGSLR